MLKNEIDNLIIKNEELNFIEIEKIAIQLQNIKAFKSICIKENYYKKRYLRQYDIYNHKHLFRIKKLLHRKKLKGVCVDKIQDNADGAIMYYLYLLDNGKFYPIKVQPFKNGAILNIHISKKNINPSCEFGIKDKKGYDLKYKWSISRINNRIKNEIMNQII